MLDPLLSHRDAGMLRLTFNRPDKKNAFTEEMYLQTTKALKQAEADPEVNVVLLHGAGRTFTAGNDLTDFLEHPPKDETAAVFQFLKTLSTLTKPVLAAVEGSAVGIGASLLLHCDHVLAGENARFALPFVNLGLSPEGATSLLLPQRAGMALASELLLFGEPFDAPTALRAGLISRIVPEAQLLATAEERARVLAGKPTESLKATKRLLREPLQQEVQQVLSREGALFIERLTSDEAREAFMAFLAKRKS